VPVVSAHFRSLLTNGRVCCRATGTVALSAATEPATAIAVASTEAVSAQQTGVTVVTEEPGLCSLERGDAAASARFTKYLTICHNNLLSLSSDQITIVIYDVQKCLLGIS